MGNVAFSFKTQTSGGVGMNCVGERIRVAVRKYCEGDKEGAEQELADLFGGSVELAQRALEMLHVFFEDGEASLVPVDTDGVFVRLEGREVSVRIRFPIGNELTVTFTNNGW